MRISQKFEFPALYQTAGQMAAESQSTFLWLIRAEYTFLILASVMSMDWSRRPGYFAAYALILLASFAVLALRSFLKPEQGWYRGRALAESIKTSSWRYCMRADPFEDAATVAIPVALFREHLTEILQINRFIGDRMPPDSAAKEQIPVSMKEVRSLSLNERKIYFIENRVHEQREWYARKAKANKRASRRWFMIAAASYVIAIGLAVSRIVFPDWALWPIEPVIVVASSIMGWTQVKKFNELASSYTLTAHEIGLIQAKIDGVQSETDFSTFINESEQAFSREHTQWVARQQN